MSYGGNARASTFFKQHGWTDGGKMDAKYTSRAAELYKQLLMKEVSQPSSATVNTTAAVNVPSQKADVFDDFADVDIIERVSSPSQDIAKAEPQTVPAVVVASHPSSNCTVKRPVSLSGAKKVSAGKSSSLGVKKLTSKVCFFF
jgi:ADP-ribosylation factor GTPase-activating protein 2/3